MGSSGLPSGAFLTSINGRRCTAIPRIAATTAHTNSAARAATTSSPARTTAAQTTGLAAAPAADADASTIAVEQTPTSTTSSFPALSTGTIFSSSVRVPEDQGSESSRPTTSPTSFPAALLPTSDVVLQSFTAFSGSTSSPPPVAESSRADGSVTAPTVDTLVSSSKPGPAETTSRLLPEGPTATTLLTTIGSPQIPADTPVAETTTTTSITPPVSLIPASNNNAVQSTVVVAGGVIGGVVAISALAFFVWWWRRRLLRKRRSTLLTPLDVVPSSFDRDGKGGYIITRGSIGPTPVTEKVSAALGQNFRKIRGYVRVRTKPSVNLDRGHSQFIGTAGTHSRAKSRIIGNGLTAKDRLKDWWLRLGGRMKPKERMVATQEKRAILGSQPDFLTLVGMDGGEQGLGALDDNPFSDANAITHTSAKPAPLVVRNNNPNPDPFSDTDVITDPPLAMPKPATYVADIRRSRSDSTAAAAAARQPSTVYYGSRDSVSSIVSFATATTTNQRNKFRSDPFDLERPELLGGATAIPPNPTLATFPNTSGNNRSSSTAATAGSTIEEPQLPPRYPTGARTRAESFTLRYSKYTSGVSDISSIGDWSDPGPDVGPAAAATAARWTPPPPAAAPLSLLGGNSAAAMATGDQAWTEEGTVSQRERIGGRRTSGSSFGSVGKAM